MNTLGIKILYVNMGGTIPYTYDKQAGRILEWSRFNHVSILAPQIDRPVIREQVLKYNSLNSIKVFYYPLSKHETNSTKGIIFNYFIRILISPWILFTSMPNYDFAISNSAFFVDVFPVLWLKLFGRCDHWILIMDSVIPPPKNKKGNYLVNLLTYIESLVIGKIAYRFADLNMTVNPELQNEMVRRGINKDKILLSKNGLFLDKINLVEEPKTKKYDGVYMGRISENKGIFDLIKVWKNLVKNYDPKVKLVVMGTGIEDTVKKFKTAIKTNMLENNIEYKGFVSGPKKYEVLKNSKVFLYLSKVNADESWGISLMEALACGLPAISYNLPIYEHIYNTESLIRFKINDLNSITEKLIYLLKNQKDWLFLSRKSVDFAKNFDWFKIAKEELRFIRRFLLIK